MVPCYNLVIVEIQVTTQLLLAWVWWEHKFSLVFGSNNYCLKFPHLLGCPFVSALDKDSRLLLGLFFLSAPIGISKLLASSVQSQGYMRQKENSDTLYHVVPWILRSLACLISTFQRLLCLFVSRVFSCTQWEKQEKVCLLFLIK